MKIVVTGGHLTPALAVIEELRKIQDTEIIFLGRATATEGSKTPSAESIVIPNLGIRFFSISVGRLQRRPSIHTIPSLGQIPVGTLQSLAILSKERPHVIVSFGSSVAFPVVLAGWVLGIPTITHEQTMKAGLANKLIARFAKKIAVSWEKSMEDFPKNKTVLVGNPIRKEILDLKKTRTAKPLIYITGGNQGAHKINEAVSDILEELLTKYEVVHQTGGNEIYKDYEKLKAASSQLPKKLQNRYLIEKWFNTEDTVSIFSKASLIVGRSGANTVSEVAALGVPAIFIPIPWASADEQTENARLLQEIGAAVILPQDRLTPKRLLNSIDHVIGDYKMFKSNTKKARKFVDKDAAKKLAQEIQNLAYSNVQ